jgi:aminopeptidase-like protein
MIKKNFSIIRKEYSGTAAKEDVAAIIRHHRIQASPGYRGAAQYVLDELQKAGLEAHIETYPANYQTKFWNARSFQEWSAASATLHLIGPEKEACKLADYREEKIALIQRSIPFRGEAEVVLLEDGLEMADYDGLDVAGKIVLTRGSVNRVHQLAVEKFGAIGMLFDGMALAPPVRLPMDLADARQYTSFWWTGNETECFGFVLTPRQGQWLRGLLKKGPVKVRVDIQTALYDGEIEVVTAVIPGTTHPNEQTLLVSHLCHPQPSANDNASGVAANLEAARTLKRLIDSGQLPPPQRSIRFLWMPEMTGSFAYLARHEDEISGMIAGLNLDMVGADQEQTGAVMVLERPPAAAASFVVDLAERLREELFDDVETYGGLEGYAHFRYTTTVFTGGSDHYIFSDPTVGVPMPMFIQWPDKFYHTSQDTLEKVSPATLNRSGALAAAFAYFVATAGEKETTWLAYEMLARFQARVGQLAQTLITEGMAGNGRSLLHLNRQFNYQLDRFYAGLGSLGRLWANAEVVTEEIEEEAAQLAEQARARLRVMGGIQTAVSAEPDEWEQKAAALIPKRNYRGPGLAIGATAELTAAEKEALYQFRKGRAGAYTAQTLAEYWADGRRTILEIVDRIEMEIGIRDAELIVREFELLELLGLVTINNP